jgi:ferrous iron transport protein B
VYALVASSLFAEHQALAVFSLYLMGMLSVFPLGLLLRKTAFREGDTPFVMELPPYRIPSAMGVFRRLWDRAKDFLLRAGTLIFLMSIVVWLLQSLTPTLQYTTRSDLSIFGRIGRFIAPAFAPLGLNDWRKIASLLSGLVAKEAIVSTMQVLYSAADAGQLSLALSAHFTGASAYAFLVFILFYPPCIAAMASIAREMNSRKYTIMTIALQLCVAYAMALIAFGVGRLFM